MPVKPDSRFAMLPIHPAPAPDGSTRLVVALRLTTPPLPIAVRHRLRHGEQVDLLARKFFGDERLWWRILDANPLIYPLELEPGAILAIPASASATRVTRARTF
jgi:hypothetical protein